MREPAMHKLLGCFGVLAVGAALVWLAATPRHRITHEAFGEIQMGMSREQVNQVLGGPPGDYGPGKGEILLGGFTNGHHDADVKREEWLAGHMAIYVLFNKEGTVVGTGINPVFRQKTLSDNVRSWLGLSGGETACP
jgi:hypothetical protein